MGIFWFSQRIGVKTILEAVVLFILGDSKTDD